jgi:hypothetical protein
VPKDLTKERKVTVERVCADPAVVQIASPSKFAQFGDGPIFILWGLTVVFVHVRPHEIDELADMMLAQGI